jgi:ubiquinone/menaquinone biosynthesis C-methylase UbiE
MLRIMHVDYDRRQHAVYAEGRALSPAVLELWTAVLAHYIPTRGQPVVVDLGSGVGTWSELIATAFDATVWGVEPSDRMRAVAQREHPHPRVRYVAGRGERIPLPDGSCDAALLSYVLHHLSDRDACARELRRVLRPGGVAIVRSAFRESLAEVPFFGWFPTALAIDERRMPARAEVRAAFASHGFEPVTDEVVWQETSPSLRLYHERLKLRAVSTLELLPDDEFAAGIERMRTDAARETEPTPVVAPVDLLVVRRAAAAEP